MERLGLPDYQVSSTSTTGDNKFPVTSTTSPPPPLTKGFVAQTKGKNRTAKWSMIEWRYIGEGSVLLTKGTFRCTWTSGDAWIFLDRNVRATCCLHLQDRITATCLPKHSTWQNPLQTAMFIKLPRKIKLHGILDRFIAQQSLDCVNIAWNRKFFLIITGKMILWEWKLHGYQK